MSTMTRSYSSYSKGALSATKSQSITSKASNNSNHSSLPNTKPLNIFYVWYIELCRRQNTNPICAVRSPNHKNDQILEFNADRIKIEDWQPIINALRLDTSLHVISIHSRLSTQHVIEDADTEEKVKKIKKWFGAICTKYILKNFLKAIGSCLKLTSVLTCLELDGLQLGGEYLMMVLKALTANKSLKYLSFKSCPIGDDGCFEICDVMHSLPNIEVLNLSGCNLGPSSAEHLSKLIKYQQINRYCESWHSSLRYEDPVVNNMAGLKRITINNNPRIGDVGLEFILNELVDDLWMKALDMQRCNITENIAGKILDVLDYSRSLEVADFRNNNLSSSTIERILEILKSKQGDETDTEYQWCYTSTTLDTVTYGTYTSLTTNKITPKVSKNLKNKVTFKKQLTTPLNQTKSSTEQKSDKETINNLVKPDHSCLIKAKDQLMQLYERLEDEMAKRQEAENKCEQLKKQVDELLNQQKNQMILKEFSNMKQYINKFISFVKQHGEVEEHGPIILDLQNALDEVHNLAKPYEYPNELLENTDRSNITIPVETSDCNDDKIQNMFQNMLGQNVDDSTDEFSTYRLDLDLPDSESKQTTVREDSQESPRSTDSESVETYKRMLEELSQDYCVNSSTEDDLSTNSGSFVDNKNDSVKMVIKLTHSGV